MALNNLHEDKFCSDETQVKQFICLHTDSLIGSTGFQTLMSNQSH